MHGIVETILAKSKLKLRCVKKKLVN